MIDPNDSEVTRKLKDIFDKETFEVPSPLQDIDSYISYICSRIDIVLVLKNSIELSKSEVFSKEEILTILNNTLYLTIPGDRKERLELIGVLRERHHG